MLAMNPVGVILVPGTWAWRGFATTGQWYQDRSPFVRHLLSNGIDVLSRHRPFVWTTSINGLLTDRQVDWQAGGMGLWDYINPAIPEIGVGLRPEDTHVIAHSHGLQVVLYAALAGCKFETLISVGSPIRDDIRAVAIKARPNIARWLHLAGGKRDRMQWFGELFDGRLGIRRDAVWRDAGGRVVVAADQTLQMPDLNHSDLLCTPEYFPRWQSEGIFDFLRGGVSCGQPSVGSSCVPPPGVSAIRTR